MHEETMPRYPLVLPRHAFSKREVARAGDLWRACQDIAVDASTRGGWPPVRYKAERTAYVMRSMVCVHARETSHGEALASQTWISKTKRELISLREVRLSAADANGAHLPIAAATQEWVHVSSDLQLMRMPRSMLDAFAPMPGSRTIAFPDYEPREVEKEHRFAFECWQTWTDPLGHVNHPVYVDWCDEAVARALAPAGIDPALLQPIAESVLYRRPVGPGMNVVVTSRALGVHDGGVVMSHAITDEQGDSFAEATTARRVIGMDAERLLALLSS
jgi:acyl-CoA thioesterase FadM